MMERQVLVVSTGGREGFAMVRGIRSAGVFCGSAMGSLRGWAPLLKSFQAMTLSS